MPPESQQLLTRPIAELFGRNTRYGFAGQNVSTAIGNYTETDLDLACSAGLLGLLDWTRTYNSRSTAGGLLGPGWVTSLSASLSLSQPEQVLFTDTDGRVLTFVPNPAGGYTRPQDLNADLTKNTDGSFTLGFSSGQTWQFDPTGRLTGKSAEGQQVSTEYDGAGQLVRASHSRGITLTFEYDSGGRLIQVAASDGRSVSYSYAADGTLATVTGAAGGVSRYASSGGRITEVTAADGHPVVSNTYDGTGLVSAQSFPPGGSAEFQYDPATGGGGGHQLPVRRRWLQDQHGDSVRDHDHRL